MVLRHGVHKRVACFRVLDEQAPDADRQRPEPTGRRQHGNYGKQTNPRDGVAPQPQAPLWWPVAFLFATKSSVTAKTWYPTNTNAGPSCSKDLIGASPTTGNCTAPSVPTIQNSEYALCTLGQN